jgi:hypothetical protein
LRRRTMMAWMCTVCRRTEIGKDSRARRPGGELGAPMVAFIGLARWIVASSRGFGSWHISQENRKVERFPWPARRRVVWSSKLSRVQLIGSAKGNQSAVRELAFLCRMGRSALYLEVRRRKETNCKETLQERPTRLCINTGIQMFRCFAITPRALDVIRRELSSSSWQSF